MDRNITLGLAVIVGAALGAGTVGLYARTKAPAEADSPVARGKYLAAVAGCNDCHTPGYFFGKPDAARFLGGSEVGFEIPGLGVFHGPNLTPDKETGLGNWSSEQIVTAIQTGFRPDGRGLAPNSASCRSGSSEASSSSVGCSGRSAYGQKRSSGRYTGWSGRTRLGCLDILGRGHSAKMLSCRALRRNRTTTSIRLIS